MSGREGSCGKCSGDGVKCSGKSYKTRNSLKCPFLYLVYQIQCDSLRGATHSNVLVHPLVGKRHTHLVEAFHLHAHLLLRHSLKNASIHHISPIPLSLRSTPGASHHKSGGEACHCCGHYTSRDTCHGKCPPPTTYMPYVSMSPITSYVPTVTFPPSPPSTNSAKF